MQTKVIVLVTDRDDEKHGEISVIDDPAKAERLVETLLEAGFEQERIRVFRGGELDLQVTHRPVVSLVQGESPVEESAGQDEEPAEVTAAEDEEAASEQSEVKFSSLFRSD